jgi:hypothetical protein
MGVKFQGRTSVKKNSYNPVWNEQIVFTEMFPPALSEDKDLAQREKKLFLHKKQTKTAD